MHPIFVRAAEPELQSIFPCGCRRGETVEVTLQGKDLKQADHLYFSRAGISAQRIGEAKFKIAVTGEAQPGACDVWAVTPGGMTAPRRFVVGLAPCTIEKEPNDTPEQAQPMSLPGVIDAKLDRAADLDWFSFEGNVGDEVTVTCRSASLDGSVEASLLLVGVDGSELLHGKSYRRDPRLSLRLPQAGTYRVRVCDRAYRKDAFSFYRLELSLGDQPANASPENGNSTAAEASENDSLATAQRIALPIRVSGRFQTRGDVDWYSFDAEKNQAIVIDSLGERLGQRMDLDIAIHDAQGKSLLTLGDIVQPKTVPAKLPLASLDAAGTWKAPKDGTYFLAVRDLYGGSIFGSDRVYELSVGETRPSFEVFAIHPNDAAARGLSVNQGGGTEIQLICIRQGGFAGSVQVRVKDSPTGVTIEPCSLAAKEISKKLTVKADQTSAEGFGVIRLVAEADIESQPVTIDVQPRTIVRPTPLTSRPTDGIAIYVAATKAEEK